MTKYDIEWRADALRECWEMQLTPLQCAQHIGVTRAMVYMIFHNREWKNVPRPPGFTYPFPQHPKPNPLTTAQKERFLEKYVRHRQTADEFAEMCGFKRESAYRVLKGFGWKDASRPPGFQYPWPDRAWSRRRKCPTVSDLPSLE